MKEKLKYFLVLLQIISFIILASSCRNNADSWEKLELANSLIDINPDSSLNILKSLDSTVLKNGQLARWAYLYGKSEYKNHENDLNDSIIRIATTYYYGKGDSLEYQSKLFMGTFFNIIEKYDSALVYLHTAFDIAKRNEDSYYSGLISRELSSVYHSLLNTSQELEWAQTAKSAFLDGNKIIHAIWMDDILANALERNGKREEALDLINMTDPSLIESNKYFRESILTTKARALHYLGRDKETVMVYDTLLSQGYQYTPYDCFLLSETYLKLNNLENAKIYKDKGENLSLFSSDSLYLLKINGLFNAEKKNYKEAYINAFELSRQIMKLEEERLKDPPTNLLIENYRLQNENLKIKEQRHYYFISFFIVSIILLVIIFTCIIISYKKIIIKKKIETDEILDEAHHLRKDIDTLRLDYIKLEKDIKEKEELTVRIHNLFSNHINLIDRIYQISYCYPTTSGKQIIKEVTESVNKLEKLDIRGGLEELIDKYDSGWMKKFRHNYPNLNEREYLFVMYLHLNMSRESIAILMGIPNVQAVSTAKYKLKKKLNIDNFS